MGYNLVIIFVTVKYILRRFRGCRQEVPNHVIFLCLLLFFYDVIFDVVSRSFVGVGNFVCVSVDFPTIFCGGKRQI